MKILVFSDSHGGRKYMDKALESHPDVRDVIFLGDGASDIEKFEMYYPEKQFYSVAGNCDFLSSLPSEKVITLNGTKIFFTHGHYMPSVDYMINKARLEGAKICLSGHTHIAMTKYSDGVYYMNPGSISRPRDSKMSYGIIEIVPKGIVTNIVRI